MLGYLVWAKVCRSKAIAPSPANHEVGMAVLLESPWYRQILQEEEINLE